MIKSEGNPLDIQQRTELKVLLMSELIEAAAVERNKDSKPFQLIYPAFEHLKGYRFGNFIVFVAIATGKVATFGDDYLCQQRSVRVSCSSYYILRYFQLVELSLYLWC